METTSTTVHTVSLQFETTDPTRASDLAKEAVRYAEAAAARWPDVDYDVSTDRYRSGQLALPEDMVDDLARRITDRLGRSAAQAPRL